LRYNRSRFAGVVIAAALGLSHASAGSIYFTGSGTGDIVYSSWNTPNDFFGFLDAYFDVGASCSGGYCVAASTPGGTPLGNFGLLIGPNYFVSNTGYGELVTLIGTGLYYEELVGFPDGAEGTVSMPNTTAGGLTLLQGNVTGIGIYATPGTTSAAFQFDIADSAATRPFTSGLRSRHKTRPCQSLSGSDESRSPASSDTRQAIILSERAGELKPRRACA